MQIDVMAVFRKAKAKQKQMIVDKLNSTKEPTVEDSKQRKLAELQADEILNQFQEGKLYDDEGVLVENELQAMAIATHKSGLKDLNN